MRQRLPGKQDAILEAIRLEVLSGKNLLKRQLGQ